MPKLVSPYTVTDTDHYQRSRFVQIFTISLQSRQKPKNIAATSTINTTPDVNIFKNFIMRMH